MTRRLAPYGVSAVLGVLVAAFALLVNLSAGFTYALIGFVGGVLIAAGTLFRFGIRTVEEALPVAEVPLEHWQEMSRHKSAVVADGRHYWVALSYDDSLVITDGLEKNRGVGVGPVIIATARAGESGAPRSEDLIDGLEVHGYDPTPARRASARHRGRGRRGPHAPAHASS